jgi:hypothetical protein
MIWRGGLGVDGVGQNEQPTLGPVSSLAVLSQEPDLRETGVAEPLLVFRQGQ